jgi:hypothetical protein
VRVLCEVEGARYLVPSIAASGEAECRVKDDVTGLGGPFCSKKAVTDMLRAVCVNTICFVNAV